MAAPSLSKREYGIVGIPDEVLGPHPGAPAQRGSWSVHPKGTAGHLVPGQLQLHLEVQLVAGEKPGQRLQGLEGAAVRQELVVLSAGQGSQPEPYPSLR